MQDFAGPSPTDHTTDASTTGPVIHDGDMNSFMADVIERSMTVPVLVYFWADWSENCAQLTPVLEKMITQAAGALHMVKLNFDQSQQLAAQMKIQSVPTAVVFANQRPVDAFAGVKTEAEVKEFLSKYAPDMQPSLVEQMLAQAEEFCAAEDYASAGALYSQAMQTEPDNMLAIAGLATCLIRLDDLENAETVLNGAPKQHQNAPEILGARAALETAAQVAGLGDAASLEQALAQNADDHQARFDLALVLWAGGAQEAAADHLLEIVRRDRSWQDDGARKQLVKFFEIAGLMDPFTIKMRKKLSSLLFV
ncbi:tetratricopeptide repeat protein [Paremcibacter congregatus]|uniref:tetratricopeptide repeat protein n=1 Tax=Paremcibacter congregatus TaxID=2043170 RepID=UPI003A9295D0